MMNETLRKISSELKYPKAFENNYKSERKTVEWLKDDEELQ